MIRLQWGRKNRWVKGKEKKASERETHSSIFHGCSLQNLLDQKEREQEVEREKEGEWGVRRETGERFHHLIQANLLFFSPHMLTKLQQQDQTETFNRASSRLHWFFCNRSSQLSTEFTPLLLTSCNSKEQSLIAQKREWLFSWFAAKSVVACARHIVCRVDTRRSQCQTYMHFTYTLFSLLSLKSWAAVNHVLTTAQTEGFGGHANRNSAKNVGLLQ